MQSQSVLWLIAISLCFSCAADVRSQDDVANEKKKETPAWLKYCNERSSTFVINPAREGDDAFRRVEQPIMLHTQPARGAQVGAVYLWVTTNGRPAAVGTVIVQPETWEAADTYMVVDEFHSLFDEPLKGKMGRFNWRTLEPGLKWNVVGNTGEPSTKFAARTAQARNLSREYSAIASDEEGTQKRPLRILPSPVYKYDLSNDDSTDVLAGFVFAGCLATDPECFLCLEIRKTDTGNKWFSAFAWFSNRQIEVERDSKSVWISDGRWGGIHIGGKSLAGVTLPE